MVSLVKLTMAFWYTNVTQRQKYRSILLSYYIRCCKTVLENLTTERDLNILFLLFVVVMSAGHSNMIQLPLGVTQLIPTANLKNAPAGLRAATPLSLVQVNQFTTSTFLTN